MMRTLAALSFCWLFFASPAGAIEEKKLVDLTYPFSAETLHWPTAKPFHLEKVSEGRTAGGYWYSSYNYGGSEHVGTHLDAPFHFAEGKWTTEQIPLGQTIGPGVVIDGSQTVLINGLQACRLGDTILEAVGPPNKIVRGEFTVLIGG